MSILHRRPTSLSSSPYNSASSLSNILSRSISSTFAATVWWDGFNSFFTSWSCLRSWVYVSTRILADSSSSVIFALNLLWKSLYCYMSVACRCDFSYTYRSSSWPFFRCSISFFWWLYSAASQQIIINWLIRRSIAAWWKVGGHLQVDFGVYWSVMDQMRLEIKTHRYSSTSLALNNPLPQHTQKKRMVSWNVPIKKYCAKQDRKKW